MVGKELAEMSAVIGPFLRRFNADMRRMRKIFAAALENPRAPPFHRRTRAIPTGIFPTRYGGFFIAYYLLIHMIGAYAFLSHKIKLMTF